MGPRCSSCYAEKCAPGVLVPIGCSKACKRRNKVHAVIVFKAFGQCFTFFGMTEKLQSVPKPLNGSPSDKHAAFQCVSHLVTYLPGNRGQQLVAGLYGFVPCVHDQKASCPISRFGHARFVTKLPKK